MAIFRIKRGDLEPPYPFQLLVGGVGFDLTGKTVRFVMWSCDTGAQKISADPVIAVATDGTGEYRWAEGDTNELGLYRVELEVRDGSGRARTFPPDDDEPLYVEIVRDGG